MHVLGTLAHKIWIQNVHKCAQKCIQLHVKWKSNQNGGRQ